MFIDRTVIFSINHRCDAVTSRSWFVWSLVKMWQMKKKKEKRKMFSMKMLEKNVNLLGNLRLKLLLTKPTWKGCLSFIRKESSLAMNRIECKCSVKLGNKTISQLKTRVNRFRQTVPCVIVDCITFTLFIVIVCLFNTIDCQFWIPFTCWCLCQVNWIPDNSHQTE